jgi:hypothetical protein
MACMSLIKPKKKQRKILPVFKVSFFENELLIIGNRANARTNEKETHTVYSDYEEGEELGVSGTKMHVTY